MLCGFYGVRETMRESKTSLPEPALLTAWLPEGAEVRSVLEVHPGTFSVILTLGEFMSRFPAGGLVTFPPIHVSGGDQIVLWHPGEGGLFYRVTQEVKT